MQTLWWPTNKPKIGNQISWWHSQEPRSKTTANKKDDEQGCDKVRTRNPAAAWLAQHHQREQWESQKPLVEKTEWKATIDSQLQGHTQTKRRKWCFTLILNRPTSKHAFRSNNWKTHNKIWLFCWLFQQKLCLVNTNLDWIFLKILFTRKFKKNSCTSKKAMVCDICKQQSRTWDQQAACLQRKRTRRNSPIWTNKTHRLLSFLLVLHSALEQTLHCHKEAMMCVCDTIILWLSCASDGLTWLQKKCVLMRTVAVFVMAGRPQEGFPTRGTELRQSAELGETWSFVAPLIMIHFEWLSKQQSWNHHSQCQQKSQCHFPKCGNFSCLLSSLLVASSSQFWNHDIQPLAEPVLVVGWKREKSLCFFFLGIPCGSDNCPSKRFFSPLVGGACRKAMHPTNHNCCF